MRKRVLDVGNCGPDHRAIAGLIEAHFDATVVRTAGMNEALQQLRSDPFDLILVNRKLDIDGSDGLDVIRHLKEDARWSAIPVMMVTNFSEHQQRAIDAGAVAGFGKQALDNPGTLTKLQSYLA